MPGRAELHLPIAGLVVALRRLCAETDRDGGRRTVVLLAAVCGMLEGRPFDVGSLAIMTGLSRATTIRLLSELDRGGLIAWELRGRRRVILPHMGVVEPLLDQFATTLLHHVSKMDQAMFDRMAWPGKTT